VGQEQANLFACEVEENGGACSEPQMAASYASRWLARGGGSRREARPTPPAGTRAVRVGQEQANLFACEVEENGGACSEPQMAAFF
jgi:hypothetical protein